MIPQSFSLLYNLWKSSVNRSRFCVKSFDEVDIIAPMIREWVGQPRDDLMVPTILASIPTDHRASL